MEELYERLRESVAAIRQRSDLRPRFGVVLGSWLGPLAAEVEDAVVIPFTEIPGFPVSTMLDDPGRLLLGNLEGQPVALLSARVHLYEGYTPAEVVFPIQVLQQLGAGAAILTNAAGSLDPELEVGSLLLIADQINLTGHSPLLGRNEPRLGPRYPDMSAAYDPALREVARWVARELGVALAEGIYLGILGPEFQTPAEVRLARALGADVVGMSTVLEVIAASHCGLPVLGLSVISDSASGTPPEDGAASLERARAELAGLVRGVI
ncbi:MAG TPA: purine-nucleoside phosphorylase, partial [Thermomicrobiaceae bacterium]|nr:purine-nucleoside phosphorylase [Thermomicrobiaceae bacterium]